jgi:hypothetical protein
MTNSKSFFADLNCLASKFLDDFYNGNQTSSQQYFFSGITQIRYQLTQVLSQNLNSIGTQITRLNSNPGTTMNTLISDINSVLANLKSIPRGTDYMQFIQTYNLPLDSLISTGTFSTILGPQIGTYGNNSTLLGALTSYLTNNLLTNMTNITTSASSVIPHLTSIDMGAQITVADGVIASVQTNLDTLKSQMQNLLNLLASIDSYNLSYSVIFYGIILGQALIIVIILIFMKCFNLVSCRYFIYFICFIMFFFCVLLFLYSIILASLMPALFYTCQYF